MRAVFKRFSGDFKSLFLFLRHYIETHVFYDQVNVDAKILETNLEKSPTSYVIEIDGNVFVFLDIM